MPTPPCAGETLEDYPNCFQIVENKRVREREREERASQFG